MRSYRRQQPISLSQPLARRMKNITRLFLIASLVTLGMAPISVNAAAGPQIFYGRNTDPTAISSTRFLPLNRVGNTNTYATSSVGVLPINGTFSNMTVTVDTAPGGAASWTITLFDNNVATGHACTITSAITSCTASGTHSATAGRTYYIKATPASSPAATYLRGSIKFTPSTAGHTALFGTPSNQSTSVESYTPFVQSVNFNTPESIRSSIFPEGGTLQNLYTSGANAPGAGKSFTYTIRAASAASSITCAVSGATEKECGDVVNTASISANDLVAIASQPSGTPTAHNPGLGIDFVPNTAGDFLFTALSSVSDSASAIRYLPIVGNNINAVEASTTVITQAMTVTAMAVYVPTAPGAAKTHTFTLRKNGAPTALTCDVTGAATNICSVSGSVSFADGDTAAIEDAPSGTPATSGGISVSLVANTNTADAGAEPARSLRLFLGYKLKVLSGRLIIYR